MLIKAPFTLHKLKKKTNSTQKYLQIQKKNNFVKLLNLLAILFSIIKNISFN